jgi:HPt (histidine-containing phosphotransfer) domain-containing protein
MDEVNRLAPNDAVLERFLDLPNLLCRVENDRELLIELFVLFQEELPGLQGSLHDAIGFGDLPRAAKEAHTLKGMLANLSMNQGTKIAASIEAAARAGDESTIRESLVAFDFEITSLSAAIDSFVAGK